VTGSFARFWLCIRSTIAVSRALGRIVLGPGLASSTRSVLRGEGSARIAEQDALLVDDEARVPACLLDSLRIRQTLVVAGRPDVAAASAPAGDCTSSPSSGSPAALQSALPAA
jgi:hypothetical protein